MDANLKKEIFDKPSERGKALMDSKSQKYANAWLFAVPAAYQHHKIAESEFRAIL
jgi:hypothetical protein